LKENKNEKGIQKLPLLAILPEGPQNKFLYNLIINYAVKILFLHRQEWLECLSKIRCNNNEKNINACISQC
jgi:hypothetical protein